MELLKRHLGTEVTDSDNWYMAESAISGRGLFAKKDIAAGQLILEDIPLISGPRVKGPKLCVVCYDGRAQLEECPEGCRLPLCSSPSCHERHSQVECPLLRRLGPKQGGKAADNLFWSLTPLRSLALTGYKRDLMALMQANEGTRHGLEIDMLHASVSGKLSAEEEEWVRFCCKVLDSVTFEVDTGRGSARGLYPLGGLLNHSCCPNTRHVFLPKARADNEVPVFCMAMVAAKEIKKDEELTTHYCPLLWGTPARRHYLSETKHFSCCCPRCSDPTEFGTYFSGLRCACKRGRLVPDNPLSDMSPWTCPSCSGKLTAKDATMIQAKLVHFVLKEEAYQLPTLCQVTVQQALQVVWKLVNVDITQVQIEELRKVETVSRNILELLKDLKLGMCRMRGLLLFYLYMTQLEIQRRKESTLFEPSNKMLQEAAQILKGDPNAPKQLPLYLEAS